MESDNSTPPRPSPHSEALTQRMKTDTCFRCKNKGHWSQNCPLRSSGGSPSKAKPSSSASLVVPVMHCTCGTAACKVATATNPRNPNRKYYSCPGNSPDGKGCGFVAWCDEFTARQCPHGVCRIYAEREKNGDRPKSFSYGCRIRKGHGACDFSQQIDKKRPKTALAQACRMEIEPPAMDNPNNSFKLADDNRDQEKEEVPHYGDEKLNEMLLCSSVPELNNGGDLQGMATEDGSGNLSHDSVVEDLAMEEIAPLDHISKIKIVTPSMMSQEAEIQSRQEDLMKQIFAVGDGLTQGLQVQGWCGRIAFQPSRCISELPLKPFFSCIFPSLSATVESNNVEVIVNRGRSLLPHVPSGPCLNDCLSGSFLPKTNDEHMMQLLAWLADLLNGGNMNKPSNFRTVGKYEEMLKRTAADVQNKFITLLDYIDPHNLELLESEAVVCFMTFCLLRTVDSGEFIRHVMHYIECASSLAKIESSHGPDPSLQLQELRDRHAVEQKHYEDISQLHSGKLNAYNVSQGRLQVLSENAARVREMLSQIEREITECQVESLELESCLVGVNQEVKRSRKSLEAVAQEFREAQDKEMKIAAAKDALEKARSRLRK